MKGARARGELAREGRVDVGRSGGITTSRVRNGIMRKGAEDGGEDKTRRLRQDERFAEANGK